MENIMIQLGKKQTLIVVKQTDFGVYLNSTGTSEEEKILLPKKQVPAQTKLSDKIEVFVYKDSEDRPIATTAIPPLEIGTLAVLEVTDVTKIGAFLDWGLAKDLLLPFKEQTKRVQKKDKVLVALYADKSNRLCATMKVYDYLSTNSPYQKEDKVSGIVYELSDEFGAFVAVDNHYSGLIPKKELFRPVHIGEQLETRIMNIREDGKLNLSIRDKAYLQIDKDAMIILQHLERNHGFLPYHDKSSPEDIQKEFQLSKNAFKRAIGHLLKKQTISLSENGITLLKKQQRIL